MSAIPLKNVFVLVLFYKSLKDADWRIRKAAELAKTVSLNDCHIAGEGEAVACISFHSDLSSDQLKDHFEPLKKEQMEYLLFEASAVVSGWARSHTWPWFGKHIQRTT